jgi:hypothetical protein
MVPETRTIIDYDFVRNMEVMEKLLFASIRDAEQAGNEDMIRYFRGIHRGIIMCKENYLICLEHEKGVLDRKKQTGLYLNATSD